MSKLLLYIDYDNEAAMILVQWFSYNARIVGNQMIY